MKFGVERTLLSVAFDFVLIFILRTTDCMLNWNIH